MSGETADDNPGVGHDVGQCGAYYLDAVNPRNGQIFSLIVTRGKKESIKRYGMGAARELEVIVPMVLRSPTAIFRGVRDRRERKWLCYCGLPDRAYDRRTGQKLPPWPGRVFLVFCNASNIVYNWRWDPCDPLNPHLPEDHEERFFEKAL